MPDRKRWLLGTACALPVFGFALAYALPPMDEYADLDRIGTHAPTDREVPAQWGAGVNLGDQSVRERRWVIELPESEAVGKVEEFLKRHPKWDETGGGSGSSSESGRNGTLRESKTKSILYTNDETGDELEVERETQVRPVKKFLRVTVTVSQTKASLQLWPKLKRWARLAFTR